MLSGDLLSRPDLRVAASMTVEGVAVPGLADWSYTRDLGMTLPGIDEIQPAAGDGRVTIAPARSVVGAGASPWLAGADASPAPMSRATLTLALSPDHSWPVATCLLDVPEGAMWDGAISAKLLDPIDSLAVPLRWEPLHARHTPLGPGAPFRHIGLTNAYVVDKAFRAGGWYATPPVTGPLDVPMCGSLLPNRGLLETTGAAVPAFTARDSMPQGACPYGVVTAAYRIDNVTLGDFEVLMEVDPVSTDAGTVRWDIIDDVGAGKGYRLSYNQATKVFAVHRAERSTTPGITTVGIHMASTTLTAGDHRVSVRLHRIPAGNAREVEIRTTTSTGTVAVSSHLAGSYVLSEAAPWRVYLTTTGSPAVGAFGIDDPAVPWATWAHVPNVDLKFTFGSVADLRATPRITGDTTALDVIRDQARAEYSAWGWLEDGRAFYRTRQWMQARPLARTIRAVDLANFSWRQDTTSVRSTVTITRKSPAVLGRSYPSVTVWQGRGDALDAGESGSIVMAPDSDMDWVRPYFVFDEVGVTVGSATAWNGGRGSFWGAALVRPDGTDAWAHLPANQLVTGAITTIDDTTVSFDYQVVSPLPAEAETVELRVPESTGLRRKGVGLPVLRSYGSTRWLDAQVDPVSAGSARAPRLEHDVGWHVQSNAPLLALRDWLVSQVSTPRARLTGVEIYPDPRLQVGDRVRVLDDRPGGTGADVTGLVTSKRMSGDPGRAFMTIDVVQV